MKKGNPVIIQPRNALPMKDQKIELVERKGTGHPDTICDSIMESICLKLCRHYTEIFGRIMHHNLDKGLLVAGTTATKPGGGTILEPITFIFGGRATLRYKGIHIPVGELAEEAASAWIRKNLRFIDPARHVIFMNEIRQGSQELCDSFERGAPVANDTSAGIGHAPKTPTEKTVYATESFLNSEQFKHEFPETGEDIKVMGCRKGQQLTLTVAMAFVDRFIRSPSEYFSRKKAAKERLADYLGTLAHPFTDITIAINALDDRNRGENGIYLTITGTSAEGADDGEVGRGNRVNGLISLGRPCSMEAAAGKNPISHVGKIYTVLAQEIADRISREVAGIEEVSIQLCSQIGKPLREPLSASATVLTTKGLSIDEVSKNIENIIEDELSSIEAFTSRLASGIYRIC